MSTVMRIILVVFVVVILLSLAWGAEGMDLDKTMINTIETQRHDDTDRGTSAFLRRDHIVKKNMPGPGVFW